MNRRGQSTLEYAVIIAIVVAALIAMQAYMKRGLQGKLRSASDDIGEQYSPGRTTSDHVTRVNVNSEESLVGGELPRSESESTQTQRRTGSETVADEQGEWWGED
ncbi:MAG: hypothetical protein FJZ15_04095 [Candidatus Omnitrophica bacterium]|nr:hypothetical protein [Candidatus Omnitrophota bacterium]